MKIEIKVEVDQDTVDRFEKQIGRIAEGIQALTGMFDRLDSADTAGDAPEKSGEAESRPESAAAEPKKTIPEAGDAAPEEKAPAAAKKASPSLSAGKKVKTRSSRGRARPKVRGKVTGAVLERIRKSRNGIDSKGLCRKTGFAAKKVADAVYQLKKKGLIEKNSAGRFVLL